MFSNRATIATVVLFAGGIGSLRAGEPIVFTPAAHFAESTYEAYVDPEVRIHVNRPDDPQSIAAVQTRVLVFALPNGNTIEQTLGSKVREEKKGTAPEPGLDWRFDIQHVAAQVRLLRSLVPRERLVLVCCEAKGLSWPAWRRRIPDANAKIAAMLDAWRTQFGGPDAKVTLTGHSGGGSFIFGVIDGNDRIPAYIDRIAPLDANYAYDTERHAEKIGHWLEADDAHRMVVIVYDDRNIQLNGKKVVSPTGGTYRATYRMLEVFREPLAMTDSTQGPFKVHTARNGQFVCFVHPNPNNKILHTALVGEMNGLVQAQTWGGWSNADWGVFGGPRAFEAYIAPTIAPTANRESAEQFRQGSPTIPQRPDRSLPGPKFMQEVAKLEPEERELRIQQEIIGGNFPAFLRKFVKVPIRHERSDGRTITGVMEVMPDYLSVGSDHDFMRVPMRPQTAAAIAQAFGCVLPTRKMVNAIDAAATVRIAPHPLTKDREAVATFVEHHRWIEAERGDRSLGALITGIKKDLVVSPRISERPHRLALFGWRKLDGTVIQNLTTVHVDTYVDYSHGVRLVRATMLLDGEQVSIPQLLNSTEQCELLSDEGVVKGSYE